MPEPHARSGSPDYRRFNLQGDHYACGFHMGRSTELRRSAASYDLPGVLEFAGKCAAIVEAQHAALLDEYRGYADAQGRAWVDVLPQFAWGHPDGVVGGCSTLVWRDEADHVMVARNYDFVVTQQSRHLIRSRLSRALSVLGTNGGLIGGRYDGVNSAGLFVALHLVRTCRQASLEPGIPFHLVPRILLETCTSARQAMDRLMDMPLLHAFNYVLADSAEFLTLEAYPGHKRVRRHDLVLATTNHYQHPDMRVFHGRRRAEHSDRRLGRLLELLAQRTSPSWDWAPSVLADHEGALCNHDRHLATLWAVIVDVTARRLAYCLGNPCLSNFVNMEWPAG